MTYFNPSMILFWLALGVVAVSPLLYVTQKLSLTSQIKLLGRSLIVAGLVYVGFAIVWGDFRWLLIELLGVVFYTLFYLLALKKGMIWLGLGWVLHPVWDLWLHLYGPGESIAPHWYAWACMSFDVVIFIYIMNVFYRSPRLIEKKS